MANARRIESDFALVVAAAVAGERCPQSHPHGPISGASITALVRAKRIRSEVYRGNWRVITILAGEHTGKSTAPSPSLGAPYLIDGRPVGRRGGVSRPGAPVTLPRIASLEKKET